MGPQPGATAAAAASVLAHLAEGGAAGPMAKAAPGRTTPSSHLLTDEKESFDLGPQRSGRHTVIPAATHTLPIPGTKETEVEQKGVPKQWRIEGYGAVVVVTPQQQSLSVDTDNSLTSAYQIDAKGHTAGGQGNVDNIGTGWPRTGAFKGEEKHNAPFRDIHSCVRTCDNAPARIPIDKLTQHQADYLESSGVRLGPPGADGVRRPLVEKGHLVMRHQLQFPDGDSPDPDTYNDRVRNSSDSKANRGMSVATINAQTNGVSLGVSGDSQGLYNLEGSPPQAKAAGVSKFGFVTVYMNEQNTLVNRQGQVQVPKAQFNQARIDLEIGKQYDEWLAEGGKYILQRALFLAGALQ